MKLLLAIYYQIMTKQWAKRLRGRVIKNHLESRGGAFLDSVTGKYFPPPVYFALFVASIVFIYNLIHLDLISDIIDYLFKIVECSGGANNTDMPVNLNITGKISVSVGEALTVGGIGFGAAKMVQACPPQTRLAATIGLGGIMGATYLASNAIKVMNAPSPSTDDELTGEPFVNSNPGGGAPLSKLVQAESERVGGDTIIGTPSILEGGGEINWFDSLPPETVLLYCCIIFMGLATYFFIGLIINVLARNYLNSLSLIKRAEEKQHKWGAVGLVLARLAKLFQFWLKESSRMTTFILSFIVLYSQIASILILLYLISLKG